MCVEVRVCGEQSYASPRNDTEWTCTNEKCSEMSEGEQFDLHGCTTCTATRMKCRIVCVVSEISGKGEQQCARRIEESIADETESLGRDRMKDNGANERFENNDEKGVERTA